jgi:hypothetical protein
MASQVRSTTNCNVLDYKRDTFSMLESSHSLSRHNFLPSLSLSFSNSQYREFHSGALKRGGGTTLRRKVLSKGRCSIPFPYLHQRA